MITGLVTWDLAGHLPLLPFGVTGHERPVNSRMPAASTGTLASGVQMLAVPA